MAAVRSCGAARMHAAPGVRAALASPSLSPTPDLPMCLLIAPTTTQIPQRRVA